MDDQYEKRLKTFVNWKSDFPKSQIALAGFVYTGEDDVVICPICQVELSNWRKDDDPTADHLRWSPDCNFFDTDTSFIIRKRSPLYTDKMTFESRLKTFEDWPVQMSQKPEELAEAGFYYTGRGDRVLCFHCGLGLKDWRCGDDVWTQHAFFYAKCEFYQVKNEKDASSLPLKGIPAPIQNEKIEQVETCDNKLLCKVCLENELSVVFMPCKHMVCCSDCSVTCDKCIICRQNITSFLKIFIS